MKLICAFVFAYVKCWFSHDAAQLIKINNKTWGLTRTPAVRLNTYLDANILLCLSDCSFSNKIFVALALGKFVSWEYQYVAKAMNNPSSKYKFNY